jgi:hypothetical protein
MENTFQEIYGLVFIAAYMAASFVCIAFVKTIYQTIKIKTK